MLTPDKPKSEINKKIIFVLWFCHIIKPEWVLSYYIPQLSFLKSVPDILLYLFAIRFFISNIPKKNDKYYSIYLVSVVLAILFATNRGVAFHAVFRGYINDYLLLILSVSLLGEKEDFYTLFKIFLFGFLFQFIFGFYYHGLVPFNPFLADEDAFGPYMVMGVVLYYFAAFRLGRDLKQLLASLLCVAGVVSSFARGAFVGLIVGAMYIWLKYKNKFMATIIMLFMSITLVMVAAYYFEGNKYLDEISTLSKSNADTESDRVFYWTKAWMIFKDYPVLGVGPRNFGVNLQRYITYEEIKGRGMVTGFWYGRVPHSLYFQLLSEQGTVGAICYFFLIFSFWKRMRFVEKANKTCSTERQRSFYYSAVGLQGGMLVYLTTGAFYDFLHVPWLIEFIILSKILHNIMLTSEHV